MANTNSAEWQCKKCGGHPSSFVGSTPSTNEACPAGQNHSWTRMPEGTYENKRNWICSNCGKCPSSWLDKRPSPNEKCPATGVKYVWVLM